MEIIKYLYISLNYLLKDYVCFGYEQIVVFKKAADAICPLLRALHEHDTLDIWNSKAGFTFSCTIAIFLEYLMLTDWS